MNSKIAILSYNYHLINTKRFRKPHSRYQCHCCPHYLTRMYRQRLVTKQLTFWYIELRMWIGHSGCPVKLSWTEEKHASLAAALAYHILKDIALKE